MSRTRPVAGHQNVSITLRDGLEIQAAHDRLEAIVHDEVPFPFPDSPDPERTREVISASLNVLCWVLGHGESNSTFADNLEAIDAYLTARGIRLKQH